MATYKMYLLRGFRFVAIRGDQEFAAISDLAVALPTKPSLDWAQHSNVMVWWSVTSIFSRRKPVPSATAYPLSGCRALWSSIWCCILCNLSMASQGRVGSNTSHLVKLLQVGIFMQMTCAWVLESTVRLQRMLNPATAWLLVHEGLSHLAVLEICHAARYSLHWILAIRLFGTNGWYFQCHLRLLQE